MTQRWLAILDSPLTGATDGQIDAAEEGLGVRLPDDYRAPMRKADGGSKDFGDSWIVLWPIRELVEHNEGYEVPSGFTYFGSNGAGEAYAWDWRPDRRALYVVMDFTVSPASAVPVGDTLEQLFSTLHRHPLRRLNPTAPRRRPGRLRVEAAASEAAAVRRVGRPRHSPGSNRSRNGSTGYGDLHRPAARPVPADR